MPLLPLRLLIFYCFLFLFALPILQAQNSRPRYEVFCVEFTDKDETPYTLLRPQDFLSARAIARRRAQGLDFEDTDLPLAPAYLAEIARLGAVVTNRSKWLNAVAVFAPDSATQEKIKLLPFVRRIYPLGYRRLPQPAKNLRRIIRDSSGKKPDYYGFGANQAYMLDAPRFHAGDYDGRGLHIAIFDGGFENAYRMPAFDSLYANNQILGTRDFVEGDDFVYEDSGHGTDVLSCMASNMPYLLVGTAPKASFYLFKTEDTKGEFWIEEFNWVAAAEYADSLGVDIINSSLGYTVFKDTMMNYDYAQDLNGKTTIAARGADIAVLKGMVVFNSAGNEGNKKWHYIGTPADAENVISVAATRADGSKAAFSSVGPTADGRIKPNLAAQGQEAYVASIFGYAVKTTSGTSFSSPILTGGVACLRQSCLNMPSLDFKRLLESYASQSKTPDSLLGYGIPQLLVTYFSMQKTAIFLVTDQGGLQNGKLADKEIEIWTSVAPMVADSIEITLYNPLLQPIYSMRENYKETRSDMRVYRIPTADMPEGAYLLQLNIGGRKMNFTVCK